MATATLYLDKRIKVKDSDCYPVKVLVYLYPGKQFLTSCNLYANAGDFKACMAKSGRKTKKQKQLQLEFEKVISCANKVIQSTEEISIDTFKRMFNAQRGIYRINYRTHLAELYLQKIEELEQLGRFVSARNYQSSMIALERFSAGLNLEDITEDFLNKWEHNIITVQGLRRETFRTHCRWLRAVLNVAISKKLLHPDRMPFGKNKRTIGTTTAAKSALTQEEMQRFFNYKPNFKTHQKAKDFWFFSYFCNGIGPTDLVSLKKTDIKGEMIIWTRKKTENAKENVKYTQSYLNYEMLEILKRQIGKDKQFLFDVLKSDADDKTNVRAFQTWKRNINRSLYRISKILDIKRLNLYASRHTFATIMRNEGVPISHLRDYLNHSTEKTTEIYIGSLSTDLIKSHSGKLLNFTKV